MPQSLSNASQKKENKTERERRKETKRLRRLNKRRTRGSLSPPPSESPRVADGAKGAGLGLISSERHDQCLEGSIEIDASPFTKEKPSSPKSPTKKTVASTRAQKVHQNGAKCASPITQQLSLIMGQNSRNEDGSGGNEFTPLSMLYDDEENQMMDSLVFESGGSTPDRGQRRRRSRGTPETEQDADDDYAKDFDEFDEDNGEEMLMEVPEEVIGAPSLVVEELDASKDFVRLGGDAVKEDVDINSGDQSGQIEERPEKWNGEEDDDSWFSVVRKPHPVSQLC